MKNRDITIHHSRQTHFADRLAAILILAITAIFAAPASRAQAFQARETTPLEWVCQAQGAGWTCEQVPAAGPNRARPVRAEDPHPLGWVPLEQLDPKQRAEVPTGCCGAYVPPQSEDDVAEPPPEDGKTRIRSDLLEGNLENTYELTGNIRISQGNRRVAADQASVDEPAGTATVAGDISIYEPGVLIIGDRAMVNTETGAARVDNGQFVLYESRTRGSAGLIDRSENEVLTLEQGRFTQCEPENEHWVLRGSSIVVDPRAKRGVARNARLELAGVPIFYWPYLSFPVGSDRQSGFLFPTVTSDGIAVPYYLNLAPNYDATLTPRYITDRGTMLEAEFRHLSPSFETVIGGAWLGSGEDDISDNERQAIGQGLLSEEQATQFAGEDRWLASLQQLGGRDQRWYSVIDYTKISDFAYFNHLDTTNLDVNRATHLRQAGELGYRLPNWNINSRVVEYQTIALNAEEPYQQLPEVNADGSYRWGDLALDLSNQFTRFDHAEEFIDPESLNPNRRRITGDRTRLDYRLAWEREWLWGFFKPAFLAKSIAYRLEEEGLRPDAETDPSITVPQGALDAGLFFERDGNWFGSSYLQTFEPRVFYFYSDYQSHEALVDVTPDNRDVNFDTSELTFSYGQLFRTTRFAGGDRIEDANQVSVGLTTRFLSGVNGAERLSASLGQIFYQDDRRVTLEGNPRVQPRSEIAGQFSAQLTDSLRFGSDVLYDSDTDKVNRGNASLRYLDREKRIFNIGYRYNRKPVQLVDGEAINRDESQGDISLVWPLTDSWSVIGRRYYDFTNERELDSIAGLEYTSCCYRFRVAWRRWLDNDLINRVDDQALEHEQGVFFELELRGLGGLGSSNVSTALSEGVYNFNRREEAILGRPID
ncbi:MAG: LPS-assembly protein LptD [Cellvibrionaceae bacterium]